MAASAAMAWFHAVAGYETPTKSPKAVALLAGARRLLAAPARRMEPATLGIVQRVASTAALSTELTHQRLLFYVVIAYFGFFRFSDLRQLRLKHFQFTEHLTVHLPRSKTDQFRKGDVVLIAKLAGKQYCPYATAKRFIDRLKACHGSSSETFVMANITRKSGEERIASTCIAANTMTTQLRILLTGLGLSAGNFSLHSLRAGGATAAAAAHAPRELIKLHGRWKSDCVDRYIEVTACDRLTVSAVIG
jgi:integrase